MNAYRPTNPLNRLGAPNCSEHCILPRPTPAEECKIDSQRDGGVDDIAVPDDDDDIHETGKYLLSKSHLIKIKPLIKNSVCGSNV